MFLIRFWRHLTKKDSVESAKYDIRYKFVLSVLAVFGLFLHGSGSRSGFSRIGSGFLAYLDSGKKFDPDREKKPGSKTLKKKLF